MTTSVKLPTCILLLELQKPIVRMGMTTLAFTIFIVLFVVVEAYRQDGYDNIKTADFERFQYVVEAYRQDGYDNFSMNDWSSCLVVVEACRQDGYDNI